MSCAPIGKGSIRSSDSHAVRHFLRSASEPAAVWYRFSAVLARSFETIADIGAGIRSSRSVSSGGSLATARAIRY